VTIAFVDVTQHADEDETEARRRRRWELARGWRFACMCDKCLSDGAPAAGSGNDEETAKDELEITDESKVEDIVIKAEGSA
jgi:mitochondrial import receptor subunit TOM20